MNDQNKASHPREHQFRVGLWDTGAFVPGLDRVFHLLSNSQPLFEFRKIERSVPMGVVLGKSRSVVKNLRGEARKEVMANNVLVDDLLPLGGRLKEAEKLDLLGIISAKMIAFREDGKLHFNYFNWTLGGIMVVSTYGLLRYAELAKRRYEVAVAANFLASLLAGHYARIGFHDENRGCLFDYNGPRDTIVNTFGRLEIEPSCLALFPESDRQYVQELMRLLREYPEPNRRTAATDL